MPEEAPPRRLTLAEVCSDAFAFAFQLSKAQDPGEAEPIYKKVDELFRGIDLKARQNDIPLENVQQAKYALCAFIDEMILDSSWSCRTAWAGRPLQLAYFNDFSAGEEFYTRLDALKHTREPAKLELLEVYFACMALGFKGKYSDLQGLEKHKVLLDSISRELRSARGADGEHLSPGWKPTDSVAAIGKSFPAWVVPVILGFILLVLFITYTTILDGMIDGMKQSVEYSGE
jgi:type VI secretion system protein ImpK